MLWLDENGVAGPKTLKAAALLADKKRIKETDRRAVVVIRIKRVMQTNGGR